MRKYNRCRVSFYDCTNLVSVCVKHYNYRTFSWIDLMTIQDIVRKQQSSEKTYLSSELMIQLEVVKFYIGNTYVLQIRNKKV